MTNPNATILIVDDEIKNRKLLEAMLRPEGYLTRTAANGTEALALIAECPPDLILLDIMMPDMDGYQVATLLKGDVATSNIPIVMVTAHSGRSARMVGLETGVEEFLTKPVDRTELCIRVRNLLRLKEAADFLKNHNLILEQQVDARTADLNLFRKAMDSSADAIFLIKRSSMRNIEVNTTATHMFGYTREELLAIGPGELYAMARGDLESVYDSAIADPGKITFCQSQLQRKDGSQFPAEIQRQAVRHGTEWIIACVTRDLSRLHS